MRAFSDLETAARDDGIQQPEIDPLIVSVAKLEPDRLVEIAEKSHHLREHHSLTLEIKDAPQLEAVLRKPDRVPHGQKKLLHDVHRRRGVHCAMHPGETSSFEAELLTPVPDWCRRIAEPRLRAECIRPGVLDELHRLLDGRHRLARKAYDEAAVRQNPRLL